MAVALFRSFGNLLASGQAPPELRAYIGSAKGTALRKIARDGAADTRPACSGETIRRFVSKIMLGTELHSLGEYLLPHQFAVGVKAGAEVMPHLARQGCDDDANDPDKFLINYDEGNARNEAEAAELRGRVSSLEAAAAAEAEVRAALSADLAASRAEAARSAEGPCQRCGGGMVSGGALVAENVCLEAKLRSHKALIQKQQRVIAEHEAWSLLVFRVLFMILLVFVPSVLLSLVFLVVFLILSMGPQIFLVFFMILLIVSLVFVPINFLSLFVPLLGLVFWSVMWVVLILLLLVFRILCSIFLVFVPRFFQGLIVRFSSLFSGSPAIVILLVFLPSVLLSLIFLVVFLILLMSSQIFLVFFLILFVVSLVFVPIHFQSLIVQFLSLVFWSFMWVVLILLMLVFLILSSTFLVFVLKFLQSLIVSFSSLFFGSQAVVWDLASLGKSFKILVWTLMTFSVCLTRCLRSSARVSIVCFIFLKIVEFNLSNILKAFALTLRPLLFLQILLSDLVVLLRSLSWNVVGSFCAMVEITYGEVLFLAVLSLADPDPSTVELTDG
ncbi:unnamed protein product [Prorocentrum cordatum]|uniref:Uncharacterized protein n=1 Tax=Prorocentrum cordatum TaxID=2364126 RepID=A0ABN9QX26_9DINO|nr:unnamed protein product [Polarella glacialis]